MLQGSFKWLAFIFIVYLIVCEGSCGQHMLLAVGPLVLAYLQQPVALIACTM